MRILDGKTAIVVGNVLGIADGRVILSKVVEGPGRFKETDDGTRQATELESEWLAMGRH